MTRMLNARDVSGAVQTAHAHGVIRQPHGTTLSGFKSACVTEKTWAAYPWRGRHCAPHDPLASPKPSWQWLVEAVRKMELAALAEGRWEFISMPLAQVESIAAVHSLEKTKTGFLQNLRTECRKRISAVYGAEDAQDELFIRMRDGADATKDAERDRLRARYAEIKTWAMGVTAKSGFDAVNLSADAAWTTTWTPPAAAGRE